MAQPSLSVIPRVSKLSPRIIRVLGCNPGPMTLQGTNTYLIGSGRRRILFDTGDGKQSEYFLNLKKSLNFDRITIGSVIVSHWHEDHVGGVPEILKLVENDCQVFKFPRSDVIEKNTFSTVKDGQVFQVDGVTLTAVHTPGHTTDHIILHLQEENAVFSGDCILGEGTTVFEDLFDYMNSLRIIQNINPSVIYPGHGPVIKDPVERIGYYLEHRNQREKQILEAMAHIGEEGATIKEIVKIVYKETPENLLKAAASNVKHHLEKLIKDKKVKLIAEKFYLL